MSSSSHAKLDISFMCVGNALNRSQFVHTEIINLSDSDNCFVAYLWTFLSIYHKFFSLLQHLQ